MWAISPSSSLSHSDFVAKHLSLGCQEIQWVILKASLGSGLYSWDYLVFCHLFACVIPETSVLVYTFPVGLRALPRGERNLWLTVSTLSSFLRSCCFSPNTVQSPRTGQLFLSHTKLFPVVCFSSPLYFSPSNLFLDWIVSNQNFVYLFLRTGRTRAQKVRGHVCISSF